MISHFYQWQNFSDGEYPALMREFVRCGAEAIVFGHLWARRAVEEKTFAGTVLRMAREAGLEITDAHADFGRGYSLNTPEPELRAHMLECHARIMEILAEAGGKTITIHIGTCDPGYDREQLRGFTLKSLETLLPAAERLGVTVAIENTLEPGVNSAEELLFYWNALKHPNLGFCFDSGHANFLDDSEGKIFPPETLEWLNRASFGKFEFQHNTLEKMLPQIVTVHLHDNDGTGDQHKLPWTGTVDWETLMKQLRGAPRLATLQNEVNAVAYGHSIEQLCRTFDRIENLL